MIEDSEESRKAAADLKIAVGPEHKVGDIIAASFGLVRITDVIPYGEGLYYYSVETINS